MAPALVELSTSKERNSSSKKYIKDFSCMSHLNIELVDKIRFADSSPLFTCDIEQVKEGDNNCKIKKFSCQGMVSHDSDKAPISNLNGKLLNPLKNEDLLKSEYYNNLKKANGESSDSKRKIKEETECCIHNFSSTTQKRREPQPLAEYKPSSRIIQILNNKEASLQENFSQIHSKLTSLNNRINKLSSKNLTAHVASFVNKSSILEHRCKIEEKDRGIVDDIDAAQSSRLPLKYMFDLISLTDEEEELEHKQKISFRPKKTKNMRPAPPVGILHQWKKSRAKVGSQCSWLTLKMATLDEKISSLNQLHTTLKTSRTVRNHNYDETPKSQLQSSLHNQNGISPSETGHQPHQDTHYGCSRTRPFISTQYHKYIKWTSCDSIYQEHKYGCRCIDGNKNCRLCAKRIKSDNNVQSRVELCDQNYHPVLSQKQDISLAFLLEETLRCQRINTKVTITKTKKKKRRPNSLETSPVEIKGVRPSSSKGKSKHDRSKSDEYSRKRYASSDISSKLKKFRKLSESCDSASKPSTPTNELASPLSQSMPSGGLSGIRRKKGASADYDINNIVIPYSIASSTRVERIQYKEIPTPGWRAANDILNNDEDNLDREVTDDETYLERHSHCELLEQRRFTDYFIPVRRQRSMRVSEGPNSEPPSPHMIDERSLVNTPLESPNPIKQLQNRLANLVVCTEDERELPWIPRKFPLTEVENAKLDIFSAPSSPCFVSGELKRIPKPASLSRSSSYTHLANITPRHSPVPSPSPLASPPHTLDNSNWTVKVVSDDLTDAKEASTISPLPLADEKHRKGIVLKLAKK